ncbi:MAG: tRNA (adenosine(37)-N6)-threonylcarbamoyltransferase complex dimerization subunit type 1 TsaB [Rikenellaceae bacterium]
MILSIESGTDICSVGLSSKGDTFAIRESVVGRDHARDIALFVDELLRDSGVDVCELEAVAVSHGPGSYTGLRIGVSFAKGLCYGLDIPLIGVGSLESLAVLALSQQPDMDESTLLCPMIDARRMEVYMQMFDNELQPLTQPEARVIDASSFDSYKEHGQRLLLFGDGAAKCAEVSGCEMIDVRASARGVGWLAYEKLQWGDVESVAYFEPFYLKEANITESKRKYF